LVELYEHAGGSVIPVGGTAGSAVEVWADLATDRVMILADQLYPFWRTAEEAEALAGHLREAAETLRRRREVKG
jgi:hypothetical protein